MFALRLKRALCCRMGDFDHTPGEDTVKDTTSVAEGMRKSSIWCVAYQCAHWFFAKQASTHSKTSSIVRWKDSDFLAERKPSERYDTTHKHHFVPKPFEVRNTSFGLVAVRLALTESALSWQPNSMGMTIPEIKEFHRKTNYEFG